MRIAICDDQKYVRDSLEETIVGILPESEIDAFPRGKFLFKCFER